MHRFGTIVFALAALASTLAAAEAPPPGAERPSPTTIFVRAQDAVDALPLPAYVAFTERNASSQRGAEEHEELRVVERLADRHAYVRILRTQDGAPATAPPRMIDNGTFPTTIYHVGDFPLADFGLRLTGSQGPSPFDAPGTPEPEASPPDAGPRVIGTVKARNIPYRVTDLGDATIDGRAVYHLGLVPLRDPGHHVLREMWVDATSSLPVRYVAERFVDGGIVTFRYLVRVDTALIDGHLVNVAAEGRYDVHKALLIHFAGTGKWTIGDVAFPATVPAWAFDGPGVAAHRDESPERRSERGTPGSVPRDDQYFVQVARTALKFCCSVEITELCPVTIPQSI